MERIEDTAFCEYVVIKVGEKEFRSELSWLSKFFINYDINCLEKVYKLNSN